MRSRTEKLQTDRSDLWFLARLLLPLIVGAIALLALIALASGGSPTEISTLLTRISGGAILSVAAIALVFIQARRAPPQQSLAFNPRYGVVRGISTGMLLWVVPSALAFGAFAVFGDPLRIQAPAAEVLTVVMLVFGAVVFSEAIPEELVFRGYLMSVLSEKFHDWWVIIAQAALFTGFALALRGWTGTADLSLFIGMGIVLGYLRVTSGSVWVTVGFHAAFQTGSQLLFTHSIVGFDGPDSAAMLALGAIPFAIGAILVAFLSPKYPHLFAKQK